MQTIIIKLGTKLLTGESGMLNHGNISRLVSEIAGLAETHRIVLVSSGAIGAGCGRLSCKPGSLSLREKQAVACVGQMDLMNVYRECFSRHGIMVGQLLLTAGDFANRKSYLNVRNTLFTMLDMKIVPVINENDSVAVEEIKFGDNDRLAAIISSKIDAEKLVILTDVEGLLDETGRTVKEVGKINAQIKNLAGGRGSAYSVGGMSSKLKAVEIVRKMCGADVYLANGNRPGVLAEIAGGGNPGTLFSGSRARLSHRKRWLAYGSRACGTLILDNGAVKAIKTSNNSLLPVGVTRVTGKFREGDTVELHDNEGRKIARGLVNYSSRELEKIAGLKSSRIREVLGYKDYDEVVNRDNMVLL